MVAMPGRTDRRSNEMSFYKQGLCFLFENESRENVDLQGNLGDSGLAPCPVLSFRILC